MRCINILIHKHGIIIRSSKLDLFAFNKIVCRCSLSFILHMRKKRDVWGVLIDGDRRREVEQSCRKIRTTVWHLLCITSTHTHTHTHSDHLSLCDWNITHSSSHGHFFTSDQIAGLLMDCSRSVRCIFLTNMARASQIKAGILLYQDCHSRNSDAGRE